MNIFTSLIPAVPIEDAVGDCAVVIDVLRATSVMATALFNGAANVITCDCISAARELKQGDTLLCGERGCHRVAGFDLGNSPKDYTRSRVDKQKIVLTTTNGTRAIEAVSDLRDVFVASFLNLSATAHALQHRDSVLLVCAGTENQVSGEDVFLAGALIDQWCRWDKATCLCDASRLALSLWRASSPVCANDAGLAESFRETRGGRNLIHVGYENDLRLCAQIDHKPSLIKRVSRTPTCFQRVS